MSKISTAIKIIKKNGVKELVLLLRDKLLPYKGISIKQQQFFISYFKNRRGIEIGGPSKIFSKEIPIYQIIKSLDGCNFSNQTIWEGEISEGKNYNYFEKKMGEQFICEASNLKEITSEKYDFLIASHCLEHCANTLKTLIEWKRVVKKRGVILLILPHKRFTFDNKRKITTFSHLLNDLNQDIYESDLSHLEEILEYHDLSMDLDAGTIEEFKNRSLSNLNNRCMHHHVFDFKLLKKIFLNQNIEIIDTKFVKPYHQIIMGIKR